MIIQNIGKNLYTFGSKSRYLLSSTPIKINANALQYVKPQIDTCKFTVDRSLCPQFLDNLLESLKLKSSQEEKIVFAKDKILKAMGYNNPQVLKVQKSFLGEASAAIDYSSCILMVNHQFNSDEQLIASIRHELDHVDKLAQLIKAKGLQCVQENYSVFLELDKNTWETLAKDARIENFDADLYLKALKEYRNTEGYECKNLFQKMMARHLYCTNPLEVSAYNIEKQVLGHYGCNTNTTYDVFGQRISNIKKILSQYIEESKTIPIKDFRGVETFDILHCMSKILHQKGNLESLKTMNQEEMCKLITQTVTNSEEINILDTVYKWLSERKFNPRELLNEHL